MDSDLLTKIKLYDNGLLSKKENYFSYLKDEAYKIINTKKFPIFIGGDHSITIPLQQAFYDYCKENNKIPAIIHLDAHPDICDEYDDSKYSHACTNRRSLDYGYKNEDIVMIGIRGFEEQEVIYFKNNPELKVYTTNDCYKLGINQIVNQIKEKFDERHAIYLSYDIDINDPSFAPGTGTPEAFGLTSRRVLQKYPFTSADSTTWIQEAKYGVIRVGDESIIVSDRQVGKPDYWTNATEVVQNEFLKRVADRDWTLEELEGNITPRANWNIIEWQEWVSRYKCSYKRTRQKTLF
jgi:hypothetical protein